MGHRMKIFYTMMARWDRVIRLRLCHKHRVVRCVSIYVCARDMALCVAGILFAVLRADASMFVCGTFTV